LGIAAGTRLWKPDRATQQERDRFRIPVLYPLLANKYYIDDLYLTGVVGPIKGPIARFTNWTNTYILDGVVNAFGAVSVFLSRVVYQGFDQRGIDLAFNAAAAVTGEAGDAVRYTTSGRIQEYAAGLFVGAVLLVVGFLIFT
jgi:NADH:ubiquinone oxidoreductase subunit 5 (subunit L)/multisubunit Na+/H+ antiporter MnhA subunit